MFSAPPAEAGDLQPGDAQSGVSHQLSLPAGRLHLELQLLRSASSLRPEIRAWMPSGMIDAGDSGSLSGSDTFDVQRGLVSELPARGYGACWQTMLAATTVSDAELPGMGASWFYLVGGRNSAGLGTLGWDSRATERTSPTRCP